MDALILVVLILAFGIGSVVLMRSNRETPEGRKIGDGVSRCRRCDNFLGISPGPVCLRCGQRV